MTPKKIALLTDSCADLSPETLKEHHIYTIPLRILCEDGEFEDGVSIFNRDIYTRLHAGELPKTSLPSMERAEQMLKQIAEDGYDGVIAVMLSSGLSGTFNMLRLFENSDETPLRLKVFDSLSGSLGQGIMLLQLAEEIRSGAEWTELVEQRVPYLVSHTYPFFMADTLEYLKRGGRIGKVTATAGTLLQIKPIITFAEDGQLKSVAKVRGSKLVIDKLVSMCVEACGNHKRYNLAVANGAAPDEMAVLRQKLTAALPNYDHIWEGELDSTLSVYLGDGMLGAGIQVLDDETEPS